MYLTQGGEVPPWHSVFSLALLGLSLTTGVAPVVQAGSVRFWVHVLKLPLYSTLVPTYLVNSILSVFISPILLVKSKKLAEFPTEYHNRFLILSHKYIENKHKMSCF